MKTKLLLLLILIGMMSCRSQQQFVPTESARIDSTSHKTELLIQRVQNLVNEIHVLEHQRDSISSRDSVSVKDSVILYVNEAGNVISKERYRDKIQKSDRANFTDKDRQIEITRLYIDSLLNAQKTELLAMLEESNQVPLPVERKLTKWEEVKQEVGGISIGVLIVIVVIAVIWLIKKIKNQR